MNGIRIGELSRRSGVPASTLRYYEAEGLLPADRAGNGYRIYGPDAVDRLAFIAQAKHLDLSLPAIRELATAWESEPCRSVRARYRPLLMERSSQVTERLVALEGLRATLDTAIERLDALPDRDGPCETACTSLDHPSTVAPAIGNRQAVHGVGGLLLSVATAPIACTLSAGDHVERTAAWRNLIGGGSHTEIDGGVRVTLPTTVLEQAAGLAAAEQDCCGFYRFRIDLNGPTFDLTVTAPPEATEMLADLLPDQHGEQYPDRRPAQTPTSGARAGREAAR
ncbi:MerR family transcriptional regulator [Promicromonospora sp. NPDC023987]|uniref:MerR family transcriptional regulator n=1 Tax=Promicromonospora sp. NPDC023987 TaxID=3155360 RepID=UPI0033EB09B0